MYVVKSIKTKREKTFQALGRNGYCHNEGVSISKWEREDTEVIRLSGINSKHNITRAFIEVGVEDLDNLIKTLKLMKRAKI